MCEENNQPPPPLTLNLPPGYLREYRRLYFQKDQQQINEDNIMSGLIKIENHMFRNQDSESD